MVTYCTETPAGATPGHGAAWIGPSPAQAGGTRHFEDSDDFLLSPDAFAFDFYFVELQQRGVRGLDLIRLIRRRSKAGLIAVTSDGMAGFADALGAGADMVLPLSAPPDHYRAATEAVQRRAHVGRHPLAPQAHPWTLLEQQSALQAPDGKRIVLSNCDLTIMQCFVEAQGDKVDRRVLMERLWGPQAEPMDNALHATVYRLRKRIEQAGQPYVPVHAVARVGYEFRAPLVRG